VEQDREGERKEKKSDELAIHNEKHHEGRRGRRRRKGLMSWIAKCTEFQIRDEGNAFIFLQPHSQTPASSHVMSFGWMQRKIPPIFYTSTRRT
jgi:hypothetical protein